MNKIIDPIREKATIISLVSIFVPLSLLLLQASLFSWDDIKQTIDTVSEQSSIYIVCAIITVIALVLNLLLSFYFEKNYREQKKRLETTLSFVKVLNDVEKSKISYQEALENLLQKECITRADYTNLKNLYIVTNDDDPMIIRTSDIDKVIDDARPALEKITYVSNLSA